MSEEEDDYVSPVLDKESPIDDLMDALGGAVHAAQLTQRQLGNELAEIHRLKDAILLSYARRIREANQNGYERARLELREWLGESSLTETEPAEPELNPALAIELADIRDEITPRAYSALSRNGIITIGDLVALTPEQVRDYPRIGKGALGRIRYALGHRGLMLKDDDSVYYHGGEEEEQ